MAKEIDAGRNEHAITVFLKLKENVTFSQVKLVVNRVDVFLLELFGVTRKMSGED